jgi:hypothetical protein
LAGEGSLAARKWRRSLFWRGQEAGYAPVDVRATSIILWDGPAKKSQLFLLLKWKPNAGLR